MKKIILLIIGIVIIILGSFLNNYYSANKKAEEDCLKYVLYSPEKQAYRWKYEELDEWYKTQDDAMKACINVIREIYR